MAAGSIVKLKLKNFMTYKSLEITPGPGLNLITGPNGTGKSTLLCAMCLGLAGKPGNLGRFERISDFIKTGYSEAYIEIELLNPDGQNIIIGRLINSSNNTHWTLNGKAAPLKMVEKAVSKFNIQTNNLCQFLPQEKVVEFSKMNPKELLESTEQAVGDQSMYDNHMQLKQLRAQYCQEESSLAGLKENLEREVEKNQHLDGEVKLHKEREKHMKRIASLKRKIPWMKYEKNRQEFCATVEEKKKKSEEYEKNSAKLNPVRKEISQLSQQLKQKEKDADSVGLEIRKKRRDLSEAEKKLYDVDTRVSDAKYDTSLKIKNEKERVEKLKNGHAVLRNLENEYLEAQGEAEYNQKKLDELSSQEKLVHFQYLEATSSIEQSTHKRNALHQNKKDIIRSMEQQQQQRQQRFRTLRLKEPDTFVAVEWLRENQHRFKKKIYEPILTLIDVPKPEAVKYIENNIAYRDLMAFFAEDPGDMNLFLKLLSDDKRLNISGIHALPVPESLLKPKMTSEQLRNFGLTHYVSELFTAPPIVMNYLCKSNSLHDIPVRFDYDKKVVKDLHQNKRFPFRKFYVGNFVFRLKTSKYGNHCQSSTSQKIIDCHLLGGSVDTTAINKLTENLQALEIAIKDEQDMLLSHSENQKKFSAEVERLRVEKKKIQQKMDALKKLAAKIMLYKTQLNVPEVQVCNIEEEERALKQIIANSVKEKIELHTQLSVLFEEILTVEKDVFQKNKEYYLVVRKRAEVESKLRNASAELNTSMETIEQLQHTIKRLKGELKISLNEAKSVLGLRPSDDIPQSLKEAIDIEFQDLPNDISDLDNELGREMARLQCINKTNPSVMQEYVSREAYIKETRDTIAAKENELLELDVRINSIKDQWLPAIETLIKKISGHFSQYFSSLGCAGEITLDKTDNPIDFEKYGLSIKVKFRDNEPLNQLSHVHHSGGECSVSTILYILSLQELTDVPFRCIDEINQGMDNVNERRVFDLITKSSCSKKKSQYFLITPKLLDGLNYSPEVEISIIHNGSVKNFKWDIDEFCRKQSLLNS